MAQPFFTTTRNGIQVIHQDNHFTGLEIGNAIELAKVHLECWLKPAQLEEWASATWKQTQDSYGINALPEYMADHIKRAMLQFDETDEAHCTKTNFKTIFEDMFKYEKIQLQDLKQVIENNKALLQLTDQQVYVLHNNLDDAFGTVTEFQMGDRKYDTGFKANQMISSDVLGLYFQERSNLGLEHIEPIVQRVKIDLEQLSDISPTERLYIIEHVRKYAEPYRCLPTHNVSFRAKLTTLVPGNTTVKFYNTLYPTHTFHTAPRVKGETPIPVPEINSWMTHYLSIYLPPAAVLIAIQSGVSYLDPAIVPFLHIEGTSDRIVLRRMLMNNLTEQSYNTNNLPASLDAQAYYGCIPVSKYELELNQYWGSTGQSANPIDVMNKIITAAKVDINQIGEDQILLQNAYNVLVTYLPVADVMHFHEKCRTHIGHTYKTENQLAVIFDQHILPMSDQTMLDDLSHALFTNDYVGKTTIDAGSLHFRQCSDRVRAEMYNQRLVNTSLFMGLDLFLADPKYHQTSTFKSLEATADDLVFEPAQLQLYQFDSVTTMVEVQSMPKGAKFSDPDIQAAYESIKSNNPDEIPVKLTLTVVFDQLMVDTTMSKKLDYLMLLTKDPATGQYGDIKYLIYMAVDQASESIPLPIALRRAFIALITKNDIVVTDYENINISISESSHLLGLYEANKEFIYMPASAMEEPVREYEASKVYTSPAASLNLPKTLTGQFLLRGNDKATQRIFSSHTTSFIIMSISGTTGGTSRMVHRYSKADNLFATIT